MGFRAERDAANMEIAAHLGESVQVGGHDLQGIPRDDPALSSGLSVQVQHYDTQVDILTVDANRIRLARGMPIAWTNVAGVAKSGRVRNFEARQSGWTAIDVET